MCMGTSLVFQVCAGHVKTWWWGEMNLCWSHDLNVCQTKQDGFNEQCVINLTARTTQYLAKYFTLLKLKQTQSSTAVIFTHLRTGQSSVTIADHCTVLYSMALLWKSPKSCTSHAHTQEAVGPVLQNKSIVNKYIRWITLVFKEVRRRTPLHDKCQHTSSNPWQWSSPAFASLTFSQSSSP